MAGVQFLEYVLVRQIIETKRHFQWPRSTFSITALAAVERSGWRESKALTDNGFLDIKLEPMSLLSRRVCIDIFARGGQKRRRKKKNRINNNGADAYTYNSLCVILTQTKSVLYNNSYVTHTKVCVCAFIILSIYNRYICGRVGSSHNYTFPAGACRRYSSHE